MRRRLTIILLFPSPRRDPGENRSARSAFPKNEAPNRPVDDPAFRRPVMTAAADTEPPEAA